MFDGHLNKCKECTKKDTKKNRESRSDFYKTYDRNRPNKQQRLAATKDRLKSPESKEKARLRNKAWEEKNKEKRKAHYMVNNAVRDGKLHKRPCEVCGVLEVEAHHPDYSKPLEVMWLCVEHHNDLHRKYDREEDLRILEETKRGSRWDNCEKRHLEHD